MTWTSGEHLKIFVNGSLAHAVPSAIGAIRNSTHPLTIGWFHDTGYGDFHMCGFIDEVRISDIDRSQGSPPPGDPVQIYLTPVNPPLTIPPGGGSFSFNAEVENASNVQESCETWSTIQVPGGYQFTAFGPVT